MISKKNKKNLLTHKKGMKIIEEKLYSENDKSENSVKKIMIKIN